MGEKIRIGSNLRFSGSWGYRRFLIGCVFVEYDLLIYNFYKKVLCMNFRIKEMSLCHKYQLSNTYISTTK